MPTPWSSITGGERVAVMQRLIGRSTSSIDYRHIIHTLVRKPGAFRS